MAAQLPRCVTDPLGTVSSLFDAAVASPAAGAEDGDWGVRAAFREGLSSLSSRALVERIPEINAVGVEHVPPGALVRFRCMVQDMYNPEYYVGAYRDAGGRWRTTKYTEDLGPADTPGQPADRKIWERRVLYCVPVPGESAWVRRLDGAGVGAPPSTPAKISEDRAGKKDKRARDEDVEMDAADDADDGAEDSVAAALAGAGAAEDAASSRAAKALRNDETETVRQREGGDAVHVHPGGDASPEDALNLPLGTEKAAPGLLAATPCIVKMYDDEDDVKLNDVLELVGVLGIAPALAQEMQDMSAETFGVFAHQAAGQANAHPPDANAGANADFEFMDEERAHNPPTSVVPRFHVLAARRASPQTFALAAEAETPGPGAHVDTASGANGGWGLRPVEGEAAFRGPGLVPDSRLALSGVTTRARLVAFLAAPLGGDALAAEYVLFSLLARVHTRSDGMPIGKFGVTLLGAPDGPGKSGVVASALAETLAILAPATAHLPLSIASLNARAWAPRKDYATNRLIAGPLQLASGTTVVLDETALSAGVLNERGVRNVQTLADFSKTQELEMDFSYHAMRVPIDVSVVSVSASKTHGIVEGLDASVVLRMTKEPRVPEEILSEEDGKESLAEMRLFIARARCSSHSIDTKNGAEIERAMVAARASDPSATQETFHRWLTMSRLAALARGETSLTIEHWNIARECERLAAERARVC